MLRGPLCPNRPQENGLCHLTDIQVPFVRTCRTIRVAQTKLARIVLSC